MVSEINEGTDYSLRVFTSTRVTLLFISTALHQLKSFLSFQPHCNYLPEKKREAFISMGR
jgi:hypothetical protein